MPLQLFAKPSLTQMCEQAFRLPVRGFAGLVGQDIAHQVVGPLRHRYPDSIAQNQVVYREPITELLDGLRPAVRHVVQENARRFAVLVHDTHRGGCRVIGMIQRDQKPSLHREGVVADEIPAAHLFQWFEKFEGLVIGNLDWFLFHKSRSVS